MNRPYRTGFAILVFSDSLTLGLIGKDWGIPTKSLQHELYFIRIVKNR